MPLSEADRRKLLASQELFELLDDRDLDDLVRSSHVKQLERGEILVRKGDPGTQIFVVASGHLKAITTSVEGADVVFNIMGPGELAGELALLSGGRRSATMEAHDDAVVLVLEKRELMPFLRRHPEASIKMMEVLARRVLRLSETLEDTRFRSLPARLAKRLLELAQRYGRETSQGVCIDVRLSQRDLGMLVITTRESVNKQIRTWSDAGLLSMHDGTIVLHDRDALVAEIDEED